ncbi:hypothetical protein BOX15_Mlig033295g1 [Macrostomum lignano]|uniref:Fucolectin tachylectin-4 pentraxin-1 domain-containing protein n=1 Tax=Macrostomum lignano TaxID=282301 RepID=A0A267GBW5_9PLAT|nr:hypothetical protein BOX15_Mlig033295g1 [Macrostomum lignano]
MVFVASLPVALLLLQCFAGCSADSSGWPSEDDSTLSVHGHTRNVIISDQGSSVPVPETDIIQQETVWLNGGDETASHEVSHKYYGPVQELKLRLCSQSSTAFSGICSRAIDGNTNQNYRKLSCTHTKTERGWWQARLTSRAYIKRIQIYNRRDCCANRLRNFYITVDGHKCAEYHSSKAFSVKTFNCDRVGAVVRIHSRMSAPLTLCEVRVFGHPLSGAVQELKLSHCSQSSTAFSGICSRAIDGNNNQNYRKHSCTHTNAGRNWWQAKLTSRAHIRRIQIFNRRDCCPNRLRSFYITVDGHKCAEYHSSKAFSVKTFNCDRVGELVRIDSKIIGYFTLCEVRVFGDPVSLESKSPAKARGKTVRKLRLGHCSQSSTAFSGVCSRAIDGNTSQNYRKHSCTHTEIERGWWQARLTSRAHIKRIQIFNRRDCCANRLRNFYITVDGHKCAEYRSSKAFSVKTFNCDRVGAVVRIHNRMRTYLTLCEVQVYGTYVH